MKAAAVEAALEALQTRVANLEAFARDLIVDQMASELAPLFTRINIRPALKGLPATMSVTELFSLRDALRAIGGDPSLTKFQRCDAALAVIQATGAGVATLARAIKE